MNKSQFFATYRQAFGPLKQEQVGPLEYILDQLDIDQPESLEHAAYLLATVKHETGDTYAPVKEGHWVPNAEEWRKRNLKYWPWYGRGLVQITHKENYIRAGEKLGKDLTTNPDAVLEQRTSYQILLRGCSEGWFTGKKLSDYIKPGFINYLGARWVVNGSRKGEKDADKASLIAGYAKKFEVALRAAQYSVFVNDLPMLRAPWRNTTATAVLKILLKTDDLTSAVTQFQKDSGLISDGIVGPDTWRKLTRVKI